MTTSNATTASKLEVPDLDLPVLPPEWRRVRRASLEELLQFGRWNDPEARAHRRELDLTPGYRCDVEFVLK